MVEFVKISLLLFILLVLLWPWDIFVLHGALGGVEAEPSFVRPLLVVVTAIFGNLFGFLVLFVLVFLGLERRHFRNFVFGGDCYCCYTCGQVCRFGAQVDCVRGLENF